MATDTSIEWADKTWSPIIGCDRVSPGCDSCYAISTAHIRTSNPRPAIAAAFAGTTHKADGRIDWTGQINLLEDRLLQPLSWKKPVKVFVNSQSDLFHKNVPTEFIARIFAVMALTPQHTYQILSKRHARMRSLLSSQDFQHQVAKGIDAISVDLSHDPNEEWADIPGFPGYQASTHGNLRGSKGALSTCVNPQTGRHVVTLWNSGNPSTQAVHRLVLLAHMPNTDKELEVCHRNGDKTDNRLANLRWGSRSENQREKVRHGSRGGPQKLTQAQVEEIRKARKAGRTQQSIADEFGVSRPLISMIQNGKAWSTPDLVWPLPNVHLGVSVENQEWADIRIPALLDTPAAVRWISAEPLLGPVDLTRYLLAHPSGLQDDWTHGLNWVVAGGESGPKARPMHPDWPRGLRKQCADAGVPYLFKQWGEWGVDWPLGDDGRILTTRRGLGITVANDGTVYQPGDLTYPNGPRYGEALRANHGQAHLTAMYRLGKKKAGRELDGRFHDEFPAVTA
ncbi:DUF5131 family protein [Streptomyces bottropensis]|uniref:DUF5131 family protein n=1 Tax=Streptomyces bottropensis TaxID=42235 RepID=UPI00369E7E1F